jgi:hypothetical protein
MKLLIMKFLHYFNTSSLSQVEIFSSVFLSHVNTILDTAPPNDAEGEDGVQI